MAYTTTYTSSRNSTMSSKRGKKILLVKLEIIYPLPKCMLISVLPNRLTMVLLQPSLEPTHDGLKICMCDKHVQIVKMIMVMQYHTGAVFKMIMECNCIQEWCLR